MADLDTGDAAVLDPEPQTISEMVGELSADSQSGTPATPTPPSAPEADFDPASISEPRGWIEALRASPDRAELVPAEDAEALYNDRPNFRNLPLEAREALIDTIIAARDVDLDDLRSQPKQPDPASALSYQRGAQDAQQRTAMLVQAARDLQGFDAELSGDRYDNDWRAWSRDHPDKAARYQDLQRFVQQGEAGMVNVFIPGPAAMIQGEVQLLSPDLGQELIKRLGPKLANKAPEDLTWNDWVQTRDLAVELLVEARIGYRNGNGKAAESEGQTRQQRIAERRRKAKERAALPRVDAASGGASNGHLTERQWMAMTPQQQAAVMKTRPEQVYALSKR